MDEPLDGMITRLSRDGPATVKLEFKSLKTTLLKSNQDIAIIAS